MVPHLGCRPLGGIAVPQVLHLLPGEPVPDVSLVQPLPVLVAEGILDAGAVDLSDEDAAAGPDQLRGQAGVVAVEVSEENIHPVPVHADVRQLALHGLPAGVLPETGVDQQAPRARDEIAVQIFQWVPHQGNIQPPEIRCDPFCHI